MLMRMASAPERAFSTAELADEFGLSRNHLAKIMQSRALGFVENAGGEADTVARQGVAEARHLHDVGANSVDHALRPRSAASRIRRFISLTASRRPVKTERLTMEWPMCSSRMPGSRAIGWTL